MCPCPQWHNRQYTNPCYSGTCSGSLFEQYAQRFEQSLKKAALAFCNASKPFSGVYSACQWSVQCFFSGPLGGKFQIPPPPKTVTNFVCFLNVFYIFSPHKSNSPLKLYFQKKPWVSLSGKRVNYHDFRMYRSVCAHHSLLYCQVM